MRPDSPTRRRLDEQRRTLTAMARYQGGVLSRPQLYAAGATRWTVHSQVRAGRWSVAGPQVVVLDPLREPQLRGWWTAVLSVAPRAHVTERPRAALDGVTALLAAGLTGVTGDRLVHVAAPKSSHPYPAGRRARVHETRRWRDEDVLLLPVPRVRPPVAAVHAALWSRTVREAALMLVAPVQQRLCTGEDLLIALDDVRRHRWLRELRAVAADTAAGVRSLPELDFARLSRAFGLPEPSRQLLVRRPDGVAYLDVAWERYGLFIEVDGRQHEDAAQEVPDALRHDDVALTGRTLLHVSTRWLRTEPEAVMAVVASGLRRGGWTGLLSAPGRARVRAIVAPDLGSRGRTGAAPGSATAASA